MDNNKVLDEFVRGYYAQLASGVYRTGLQELIIQMQRKMNLLRKPMLLLLPQPYQKR